MTQHDTKSALTNTEILFFICGYQGGTVHELAEMLGTVPNDILWATPSRMGDLMRLAQTYRNNRDLGRAAQEAELVEALEVFDLAYRNGSMGPDAQKHKDRAMKHAHKRAVKVIAKYRTKEDNGK